MSNQARHYHLGCGERLQASYQVQPRKMRKQTIDEMKLSQRKPRQRVKQES